MKIGPKENGAAFNMPARDVRFATIIIDTDRRTANTQISRCLVTAILFDGYTHRRARKIKCKFDLGSETRNVLQHRY